MNNLRAVVVLLLLLLPELRAAEVAPPSADWRALLAQADALPTPTYTAVRGEFTLSSTVPRNPTVTVTYVTPVDATGKPAPLANDVVVYFHYPSESVFATNTPFIRLWQDAGFTVMCVFFAQMADSDGVDLYDQKKNYVWAESGAFAAVLAAHQQLVKTLKLPERKLLLYGESAGGTAAQHFSEEYPERCAAVVTLGGHRFLRKHTARCPYLILSALGDATTEDNVGLALSRQRVGDPFLAGFTTPDWSRRGASDTHFNHCMDPAARTLALSWLQGVAELRASHAGVVPPAEQWLYACARRDPRVVYERTVQERTAAKPGAAASTTQWPLPSLRTWAHWLRLPSSSVRLNELTSAAPLSMQPGKPAATPRKSAATPVPAAQPMPPLRMDLPARHVDARAVVLASWQQGSAEAPPAGDPTRSLQPRSECTWDLRLLAERGYASVILSEDSVPGATGAIRAVTARQQLAAARQTETDGPAWGALPVLLLAYDPQPADLDALAAAVPAVAGAPRAAGVVLVLSGSADPTPLLPGLTALIHAGAPVHALVLGDGEVPPALPALAALGLDVLSVTVPADQFPGRTRQLLTEQLVPLMDGLVALQR